MGSEEQFGRPIPSSGNILSERRPRPNLPRKSKIAELDMIIIQENVLRLQIPVEEPVFMQAIEALQYLIDDGSK